MSEQKEKKGFFSRLKEGLTKTRDSMAEKVQSVVNSFRDIDEAFYEELEEALITADIGVTTTEAVITKLRARVVAERLKPEHVREALRDIIADIMRGEGFTDRTPCVVFVVGVNGVGKTTTIGRLAHILKAEGKSVLIAAADTFRAAAAEQLTVWAERADAPIVKHGEGADPSAVVYDALQSAKARGYDYVIIDTAGRLHNKVGLMEELKKMRRVIAREYPDAAVQALLVLDATTGQNGLAQARVFKDATQLDGIVLTKLDGTAKGGIAVAVRQELSLPVMFVGVGEQLSDMHPFNADDYAAAIL